MDLNPRRKLAIAAAVLAACSFAGGAYAATQDSAAPSAQAFINDAAKRLGVTPQQLTSALDGALQDQLNAAVKAGRLTQAQASAIEQRVRRGGFFSLGLLLGPGAGPAAGPGPFGFGRRGAGPLGLGAFGGGAAGGGAFGAAAGYLGVTTSQLLSELRDGKSLAQIAAAHGKSTSGLSAAITAAISKRINSLPHLTASQKQRLISRLRSGVAGIVNQSGGHLHMRFRFARPRGPRLVPPAGGSFAQPSPPSGAPPVS
jgi:hypothetical protein